MRIPFTPIVCSLVSFIAGYVAFHPAWRKVAPVSDGSVVSFQQASEAVASGNLLEMASPQERVGWLVEICRQPEGVARNYALYEAIQKMQPSDFVAGFAQLEALAEKIRGMSVEMSAETQNALATEAMERWLNVDPAGAHRILSATAAVIGSEALKLPELNGEGLLPMYRILAQRDPEWTAQMIVKLDEKTGRSAAIFALLSEGVARNSKQGAKWQAEYAGPNEQGVGKLGYVCGLMTRDPQAGLAVALAEHDEKTRSRLINASLSMLAESNPAAIPGLLPQLNDAERRSIMRSTAKTVLADPSVDPFHYLEQYPDGGPRDTKNGIVQSNLNTLLERDPAKTMELIRTLPDADGQHVTTTDAALQRWSKSDPAGLLDWLSAQPPEKLPAGYAIGGLASADPAKFSDWMANLPTGPFRDGAQLDLANAQLAHGNTAAAMAAFPQDLTSEGERGRGESLASNLAKQDLQGTVNWVSAMPAGPQQAVAASGLAKGWAGTNPDEAANWLQTLPSGNLRDAATSGFADAVASTDPEAAGEWIGQIGDPDARASAASKLMSNWQRRDAMQANAWMTNLSGVPDSLKNYWLNHTP